MVIPTETEIAPRPSAGDIIPKTIFDTVPQLARQEVVPVKIKLLHPSAKIPEYKFTGDAGFDLCTTTCGVIHPGKSVAFGLGIAMAIPEGFELQVRPRSGLSFNTPLMAKNTIGTIDSGYSGEICFALHNTGDEPVYVEAGDRICQGVLSRVPRASFELVDNLPATERGNKGFGSTGK